VRCSAATSVFGLRRIRANREILGGTLAWQIFEETETMLRQSLEGQAMELGWIRDNVDGLGQDDYFRMCLKKTSWYTCVYPCRLGTAIAQDGRRNAGLLDRFGWFLGAAFQIQDDVLNLVGSHEEYGKEILGDLYEGKRTLMVIHLQSVLRGEDGERLRVFLRTARRDRTEPDVRWIREQLDRCGSIDAATSTRRSERRPTSPTPPSGRPTPSWETPLPAATAISCSRCPSTSSTGDGDEECFGDLSGDGRVDGLGRLGDQR
jgi:geranylgeranyl diphosphate synthase type II